MKRNIFFIFIITVVLISCSKKEFGQQGQVIAQINGDRLTEDILKELSGVSSIQELTEDQKREKVDEWIKITLLAQEAERLGMVDNPTIQARVELSEKAIKANTMIASLLNDISLTEEELFNYYQIHKGNYLQNREEYRIQRIFFRSESKADSVSRMIINGEINFSEAARIHSEEDAKQTDGFIGYLTLEEMGGESRRAVNSLSQWRYMKIKEGEGYYLIRYTDKGNRNVEKSFIDVLEEIKEEYLKERKKELIDKVVGDLMSSSDIVISG